VSVSAIQSTPRMKAENRRIAEAALKNVPYEDLASVIASLVQVHGKARTQIMLDMAQELTGL